MERSYNGVVNEKEWITRNELGVLDVVCSQSVQECNGCVQRDTQSRIHQIWVFTNTYDCAHARAPALHARRHATQPTTHTDTYAPKSRKAGQTPSMNWTQLLGVGQVGLLRIQGLLSVPHHGVAEGTDWRANRAGAFYTVGELGGSHVGTPRPRGTKGRGLFNEKKSTEH